MYKAILEEYEQEYFDDLTFQPGSIIMPFIEIQYEDNGKLITSYDDVPFEMQSICNVFDIEVNELNGFAGETNIVTKTITISPDYKNDKSAILHEMIHAYESTISDYMPFFKEILILCLYKDLSVKIPDLDERLVAHAQIYRSVQITYEGGIHGVLFYLKSLDLDLRCGYSLGTVCGYGRDELIKGV